MKTKLTMALALMAAATLTGCAGATTRVIHSGIGTALSTPVNNAPTALCHFGPVGCVINGVPQWKS